VIAENTEYIADHHHHHHQPYHHHHHHQAAISPASMNQNNTNQIENKDARAYYMDSDTRSPGKKLRHAADWMQLSCSASRQSGIPMSRPIACTGRASYCASRLQVLNQETVQVPGPTARSGHDRKTLKSHTGCVNSLAWNQSGTRLLSGSDDTLLKIWNPSILLSEEPLDPLVGSFETGHASNIFSARFMPSSNDCKIVSCAADGMVRYMQLSQGSSSKIEHNGMFRCHGDMAYEVLPDTDNPNLFFSCSDDGTVNQYDLRERTSCTCSGCGRHLFLDLNLSKTADHASTLEHSKLNILFPPTTSPSSTSPRTGTNINPLSRIMRLLAGRSMSNGLSVSAISIHPIHPVYLAAACSDDVVRVFDRRLVRPRVTAGDAATTSKDGGAAGEVYAFRPVDFGHARKASLASLGDSDLESDDSGEANANNHDDADGNECDSSDDDVDHGHINRPQSRWIRRPKERQRRAAPPSFRRITAMKFDPVDGRDILISYSGSEVYLISPNAGEGVIGCLLEKPDACAYLAPDNHGDDVVDIFKGHSNRKTMVLFVPSDICILKQFILDKRGELLRPAIGIYYVRLRRWHIMGMGQKRESCCEPHKV
jgi:hypothetical protein